MTNKKSEKELANEKSERIMNGIAAWASFYRANPQRFVKDYLNVNLKLFQKILIYMMMWNNYFMYIAARGQGKSYLVALFCCVRCILFPRTKICIASSTRTQANEVLLKIKDDFMKNYGWGSANLKREITSVKIGQNEGMIVYLLILALTFAYLFLVAQYESWTMPISVILSVGTATLGGLFALLFYNMDLNIYCQLGLLMLVGLTAKSAILMAEYSKQERDAGKSIVDAALNGMRLRFRSVMMTALSFVIGVFPMVFASGAGAGSRQSIGITTFWGMLVASVIGMMFIPCLYAAFQRMAEFTVRLFGKMPKEESH